jgi:hypothetical protein
MIAEPPDTFGLWSQVKAQSEWPDTDEVAMAALGAAYVDMAANHEKAAKVRTDGAAANWTDEAGALFVRRVGESTQEAGRLAATMQKLGDNASRFAASVADTKTVIRDMVTSAIPGYGALALAPPGVREMLQAQFVTTLAGNVNQAIRNALPTGDEYADIQRFIFDEMVRNANSGTVDALQFNNAIPTPANKAIAYAAWAEKVAPNRDWDHKLDILHRTAGDNQFTPLPSGNGEVRYDLWSNIHYGYVGREAGFTDFELRKGADAVDYVMHGHTEPADDVAVRIGIELREQYDPGELRPEHIEQAIERHRAELEQTGMIR